jgi:protein-disulfide isomerase
MGEQRGVGHYLYDKESLRVIIKGMRSLLLLLPAALLMTAQTPSPSGPSHKRTIPEHKAAAPPVAKNFKLSGSPSAPITVELYTDYECPSCRTLYMEILPALEAQYVATGKVQLLHRDFPLPQHQFARLATKYANAAGQIGRYELVASQLFKTQPEWSQNGNVDATVAKVLPPGDMQKVRELVKSDTHLDDTVTADLAMGARDNLNQTPTMVIVNKGKRQKIDGPVPFNILKSYLDQMLAKG